MKIINEELRAEFSPVFDVVTREIKLSNFPDTITRHVVIHNPVVSILVYDPQSKLFSLGYEYRSGVNQYRLSNSAGFIDEGETPRDAAARELSEELGVSSDKELEFISILSSSEGFTNEEVFMYYAEGPFTFTDTDFDSDEYVELTNLTEDEFRAKIHDSIIRSAPTVASFYWWMANKKLLL